MGPLREFDHSDRALIGAEAEQNAHSPSGLSEMSDTIRSEFLD
jgi:hypothetical protein